MDPIRPDPAPDGACDRCGAPVGPDGAPEAPATAPPPAADDAEQAPTHCEWCGAEYPVPDEE